MQEMVIVVKSSGVFGGAVLLVTVLMGIGGVIMLASVRKRCMFYTFAGLAAVPILLGVIGTMLGYSEVYRTVAESASDDPAMLRKMLAQARIPLFLGAGGFGALLLVSLAGLLLCKGVCDGEDEANERVHS